MLSSEVCVDLSDLKGPWYHPRDLKGIDMFGGAKGPGRIFESPNLHQCRLHCGDPWVDEHGREWFTLEICHLAALKVLSEVARSCKICNCRGADSFLTHQIRKMVATAALAPRPRQREMHKSDERMKNDENIEN